jgi:zinc transporter ZupT
MIAASFAIAVILSLVHILGGRFSFLEIDPRSRWLSAAGGVTIAFLLLHLIPELNSLGQELSGHDRLGSLEQMIYVVALVGVTIFYGLEHLAFVARPSTRESDLDSPPFGHDYVFWVHMGWFALYNMIIGILLTHGQQEEGRGLVAYGIAMGFHFAVVDAAMRSHHRHVYRRTGRWLLAPAVIAGWAVGTFVPLSTVVVALITAFLAGAMLITSVKDEIPSAKQARFVPFASGAVIAAAVLVLL